MKLLSVATNLTDFNLSQRVMAWQSDHGRHDLPWQNTTDAYHIWLSEVMLQQTQVSSVVVYYQRFLQRFPSIEQLAAAHVDEVLALWAGLGYYSRARNLHACAQRVVKLYGGRFPSDPNLVQALPGIGRSTAAAICAFAYGTRAAILDGNVKRVLARAFGVAGFTGQTLVEQQLWQLAHAHLPAAPVTHAQMIAYTQGLMDLGATLCTRTQPACARCPLNDHCVAHLTSQTHLLPTPRPRKAIQIRRTHWLIHQHARQVWLMQRPERGIWGGLWALPELAPFEEHASTVQQHSSAHTKYASALIDAAATELRRASQQQWVNDHVQRWLGRTQPVQLSPLPVVRHAFTHYTLIAQPWLVSGVDWLSFAQQSDPKQQWVQLNRINTGQSGLGLPTPVQQLLQTL